MGAAVLEEQRTWRGLPQELVHTLTSSDSSVRYAALRAPLPPEARPLLRHLASNDTDEDVKDAAKSQLLILQYQEDRLSDWHNTEALSTQLGRVFREYTRTRLVSDASPGLRDVTFPRKWESTERKIVGRMLADSPLIEVSPQERSVLRLHLRAEIRKSLSSYRSKLKKLADPMNPPTINRTVPFCGKPLEVVTRPDLYESVRTARGDDLVMYGSRTLRGYMCETGIDPGKLASEALLTKKGKIRFLDVGCCVGQALYELKCLPIGNNIETHGLSFEAAPHYPCDQFYFKSADYLPPQFRNQFDVIVSSRCLEYVLFAHKALEGIAEALSPGGIAHLQWRPGRVYRGDNWTSEEIRESLLRILPKVPSSSFLKLYDEGLPLFRKNSHFQEIALSKRENVGELYEEEGERLQGRLAVAWADSVEGLRQRKDLSIDIQNWTMSMIGPLPGVIKIRKHPL